MPQNILNQRLYYCCPIKQFHYFQYSCNTKTYKLKREKYIYGADGIVEMSNAVVRPGQFLSAT